MTKTPIVNKKDNPEFFDLLDSFIELLENQASAEKEVNKAREMYHELIKQYNEAVNNMKIINESVRLGVQELFPELESALFLLHKTSDTEVEVRVVDVHSFLANKGLVWNSN